MSVHGNDQEDHKAGNSTDKAENSSPRTTGGAVVQFSPQLTGSGRRYLRGLGHHLKPVVLIGDRGAHEGVIKQVDQSLLTHELIKIKIHGGEPEDRINVAREIFSQTGGQVVQILGGTLLVYRAHPKDPKIVFPRAKKERR